MYKQSSGSDNCEALCRLATWRLLMCAYRTPLRRLSLLRSVARYLRHCLV